MDDNFENKTVIITGGSAGVGAATARRFAAAGANLVLVARSRKNLERIAEELRAQARIITVPMDVANTDDCVNLLKKAQFEFEGVHILVNNAGTHIRGPVVKQSPEDLGRMIDVNLRAPIVLSRVALPFIKESGGGAIINVASLAGRTPVPGAATYSASKFGLRAFTFALAEELRDSDDAIKIAAVSPGPISTGFILSEIDAVEDVTFFSTDEYSRPGCSRNLKALCERPAGAFDAASQRAVDHTDLPIPEPWTTRASGAFGQRSPR